MSPASHRAEQKLGGRPVPVETSLQDHHLGPGLFGLDTARIGGRGHPDVLPVRVRVLPNPNPHVKMKILQVSPDEGNVELGSLSLLREDSLQRITLCQNLASNFLLTSVVALLLRGTRTTPD